MRPSLRESTRTGSALLLLLLLMLVAGPLVWSLYAAVLEAADSTAWAALANDPQTLRALLLSLWTGMASTVLSYLLCKQLLGYAFTASAKRWARLLRGLPPILAVPHAAFAIGMVALMTPGGWLLRALSPWATGLDAPPDWTTTQDPWGLDLIAVLVLKETPFLLWVAAMQLQQSDRAQRLRKELTLAQTMAYSASAAWQRVAWPQIRRQLQWPLLAVLAYGLSVVDVAMLIGPTSPPTLALLTWQWLQDADTAVNAQGAAAAWLMLGLVALCAAALHAGMHLPVWRARWTRGVPVSRGLQIRRAWWSPGNSAAPVMLVVMLLPAAYVAVLLALAAGSVVGVWPFPALLPQSWTLAAWESVWESRAVLTTSFSLAMYSAASALIWSVVWLEWAPMQWQRKLMQIITSPWRCPRFYGSWACTA
jgi:putative thiamine transport system permease protein